MCIQGDWSNVVDGKIKGRLASLAMDAAAESTYNPLYARGSHAPKPWGITALFAEHTGNHPPLDIEWSLDRKVYRPARIHPSTREGGCVEPVPVIADTSDGSQLEASIIEPYPSDPVEAEPQRTFSSFREFALALNRQDPVAVAMAGNGAASEISMEERS